MNNEEEYIWFIFNNIWLTIDKNGRLVDNDGIPIDEKINNKGDNDV